MSEKEDSMENLEVTPIQASIIPINTGSEIEKILMKAGCLDETNTVYEPTCIICMSPYREEAEKLFSENKNEKEIKDFFANRNFDISTDVVKNHFELHLSRGVREIQMGEYANKIKRLDSQNLTTLDIISFSFSVLMERLMGVNSLIPTSEESQAQIEKIKSSETGRLMSAINSLLKLRASILGEMKNSGELITIPTGDFVNIFNEAIIEANNDQEREVISDLLTKLEAISKSTQ